MHSADPYMRIVMLFDQDPTARAFLRADGDGGFAGAVERMAREIDRLRAEAIVSPAECSNCDDPNCPYSHNPLTLRRAYENSLVRLRATEAGASKPSGKEG